MSERHSNSAAKQSGKWGRDLAKVSYKWHRSIGVILSLPLVILCTTGLLLNHSSWLNLEARFVTNQTILSLYGMVPSTDTQAIKVGDSWVSNLSGTLYFNEKQLQKNAAALRGALSLPEFLVVVTEETIILLDPVSAEVIEQLGAEVLPPGKIISAAAENGRLLLDTTAGSFSAGSDFAVFKGEVRANLKPAAFDQLPQDLYNKLLQQWRGEGVSLWRFLLDLHSGHLFGGFGRLFADFAAIGTLFLVLSGLFNWGRRKI